MHEIAVLIAEELYLDVARPLDKFFEKDIGHTERGAGFALGLIDGVVELGRGLGDAHAAAAQIALTWDVQAAAYGQNALGIPLPSGVLL